MLGLVHVGVPLHVPTVEQARELSRARKCGRLSLPAPKKMSGWEIVPPLSARHCVPPPTSQPDTRVESYFGRNRIRIALYSQKYSRQDRINETGPSLQAFCDRPRRIYVLRCLPEEFHF